MNEIIFFASYQISNFNFFNDQIADCLNSVLNVRYVFISFETCFINFLTKAFIKDTKKGSIKRT